MIELESNPTLNTPSSEIKSIENFKMGINNILYQINVGKDGNLWCALVGNNLQDGIAGFGSTVAEALRDLANQVE